MNHVKILKNRIKGIFLAALLLCAFGCMLAGTFLFDAPNAAYAETQSLSNDTNASLFLPASYEEYLALKSPSDVALSSSYIAIADGDVLYVYDRAKNSYSETKISEEGNATITKIGFAENRLFISTRATGGNQCYEYNFTNDSLDNLSFNCSTFCISGEKLYTATVGGDSTTFASYSVSNLTENNHANNLGTLDEHTTPSMTVLNGTLYCTVGDRVYHINPSSETFSKDTKPFYLSLNASDTKNVQSTCAHAGGFYYTAADGLYRADFSANDDSPRKATCVLEGENFGALTSYNGSLYCVCKQSVLRFDTEQNGTNYTVADYEISASSASVGRLDGATDLVRAGSLLVAADTGNRRVTVYDSEKERYAVIDSDDVAFSPTLVATDGSLIAAASGDKVYVCKYSADGTMNFGEAVTVNEGTIKGLACVYGNVYYITQNDIQGKVGGEHVTKSNGTPSAMTSDLYGNLYVAYADHTVRRFTEEQFAAQEEQGTLLETITVRQDVKALRADFEGNLYWLEGNALMKNGAQIASFEASDFVYLADALSPAPLSFALGFEDDRVSVLFGDFIVRTTPSALDIPSLSEIGAGDTAQRVFTGHDEHELFADVPENSVGIRVDLAKLREGGTYFGYLGYFRTEAAQRGVLLAEQGEYSLISLQTEDGEPVSALFRSCTAADETYFTPLEELGRKAGYWSQDGKAHLSNEFSVYYFPCLAEELAAARPARGSAMQVIGVVSAPDHDYAYVEYGEGTRALSRGFVPVSVLSEADPNAVPAGDYFLGYLKAGREISFTSENGETKTVSGHVRLRLFEREDGSYYASFTADGTAWTAVLAEGDFERGESDAWRIALIVILCVLALVIVGAYVFLLPWEKRRRKQ